MSQVNKIAIAWPDSEEIEYVNTPLSLEQYINERFGSSYEVFVARGGEVAVVPPQAAQRA